MEVLCDGAKEQGGLLKRLFGSDARQENNATFESASQTGHQYQSGHQSETQAQTSSLQTNIRTIR